MNSKRADFFKDYQTMEFGAFINKWFPTTFKVRLNSFLRKTAFRLGIYNESKRLLHLIEDILKLSFLDESSTKNIPFAKVELKNLLLKVYSNLKSVAKKYDIEFKFELEEAYIHGSKELLEHAIFNLCDNAIRYNHPGGYVKIKIKNLKDCVELSIKDSGIGIEPSSQERIFERFYCVDKSYSKKVGGTGLGLSIVKSVLNMHHAKVKLKSQKDIGSEFIIIFEKS